MNNEYMQDIDDAMCPADSEWAKLPHKQRLKWIRGILRTNPLPVAVYAQGVDRNTLLGYAFGSITDIRSYFEDRKGYGLQFETIKPVYVPEGYHAEKASLLREIKQAEQRLDDLNRKLKLKGPN